VHQEVVSSKEKGSIVLAVECCRLLNRGQVVAMRGTSPGSQTRQIYPRVLGREVQLRKAFHCNSFGLCPKCWPENFQFFSVNLCQKAIILLKLTQKMDKNL
jgi:hypothetical protein